MTVSLDATDWAILIELQQDGRIALTELGRRVNLSASATSIVYSQTLPYRGPRRS
jgi:Lrp/AsnC family leucine-responsive transcriptional regulator